MPTVATPPHGTLPWQTHNIMTMADAAEILSLFTQGAAVTNSDQFLLYAADGVNGNHAVKITAEVVKAYLLSGFSVTIGDDGYWYIGGEKTNVKSEGTTPRFTRGTDGVYYSLDKGTTWSLLFNYSDTTGQIILYHTESVVAIRPNVFNKWGEMPALNITLGPEVSNALNEYMIEFVSGETATELTFPDNIKWIDDVLVPEPNTTYQISIVNGLAVYAGWSKS